MENQAAATRSPTDFLSTVLGQVVKVKLNSGIDYKGKYKRFYSVYSRSLLIFFFAIGTLACLDGYMNIALENTEEYVDGRLKNTYGDTFIRGNNGILLMLDISSALLLTYSFL